MPRSWGTKAMATPLQQPFPRLDTPMVDGAGKVSIPWYQLLVSLWQKAGAAYTQVATAVALQLSGSSIQAINTATGQSLGFLVTSGAVGPVTPLAPGASPWVYQATSPGTIVVTSAQVELSRDGVTWYIVSPMGGAIPMQADDQVRLTYYGAAPAATFFGA